MDRRRVYDLLEESGIDVPRHVFMSRDGYVSSGTGDGPKKREDEEDDDEDEDDDNQIRSDNIAYAGHHLGDEPEIDEHDDHIKHPIEHTPSYNILSCCGDSLPSINFLRRCCS